ncbi:hypothetical protein A2U01_0077718 [Trifolium medium]|uniref:Uncharacterized protein n=1 Tax=Trifolium medium TaxID=97028 RepID=A0A392T7S9_9FABA|nr:hypothetical protein [Trifolium medium]
MRNCEEKCNVWFWKNRLRRRKSPMGRNSDVKMLLEISPGERFWRLVHGFVAMSVLRNRDRA